MSRKIKIRFEFKIEDLWIGVFWKTSYRANDLHEIFDIWICFVPCIPLHVTIEKDLLSPEARGESDLWKS